MVANIESVDFKIRSYIQDLVDRLEVIRDFEKYDCRNVFLSNFFKISEALEYDSGFVYDLLKENYLSIDLVGQNSLASLNDAVGIPMLRLEAEDVLSDRKLTGMFKFNVLRQYYSEIYNYWESQQLNVEPILNSSDCMDKFQYILRSLYSDAHSLGGGKELYFNTTSGQLNVGILVNWNEVFDKYKQGVLVFPNYRLCLFTPDFLQLGLGIKEASEEGALHYMVGALPAFFQARLGYVNGRLDEHESLLSFYVGLENFQFYHRIYLDFLEEVINKVSE